jgi:hypothetical protein
LGSPPVIKGRTKVNCGEIISTGRTSFFILLPMFYSGYQNHNKRNMQEHDRGKEIP